MNARVCSVEPDAGGFALRIDGVGGKTPAGAVLRAPTAALAEAMAAELRAQGEKIKPQTMPLTQLAMTAVDRTARDRSPVVAQIAAYAATDLVCHEAEEPAALVARQKELWTPLRDWCADRFGARLLSGTGIMPVTQRPEAVAALRRAVESLDDFRLTGVQQAAHVSGSLVLALALAEGHCDAGQVFAAAEIDTLFQIEKWGEDPALASRHADIRNEFDVLEKWFALLAAAR